MKSPFPGMDPLIEASGLWGDFHDHLIEGIYQELSESVPKRYFVRTEQRHYIALVETDGKKDHQFIPDVGISGAKQTSRKKKASRAPTSAVALAEADDEPVVVRAAIEQEFRESFVEIYLADPTVRLVTTIEVLSPSNKRSGPGREEYLRKRQATLLAGASLVEIDLLRGGERMPMLDPWPDCPYLLTVGRRPNPRECTVWRGYSLRRLPVIPVPLVPPDPDIPIDLQPMIDTIYRRSRYSGSINYAGQSAVSLLPEERLWLEKQLSARAKK